MLRRQGQSSWISGQGAAPRFSRPRLTAHPQILSLPAARRIAIAAQGFADRPPAGIADRRHLRRVLARIGLLQIDSVSVVARAHYLPLLSRLGPYPRALLDQAAWGRPRMLFEYWAHEASLLPMETQPLLRWRMARAEAGLGMYAELARFGREHRVTIDRLHATIAVDGPRPASALEGPKGAGGWWGWSEAKRALEWLFWAGHLTTASRRGFERVYDLPERVLPPSILACPTPSPADAQRELLRIAARALGVATASDLRDYFRLSPGETAPRIPELVEAGDLVPVSVAGWQNPAYLHRDADRPRRVAARALLAPFDPLVWDRARAERLFGFRYRLEIYTPAARRVHGYYVLPFLLGDRLVARVDLKSDRAAGCLRVLAAHAEPHAPPETAGALAVTLREMADWLTLGNVVVSGVGDLAGVLASSLRHTEEEHA